VKRLPILSKMLILVCFAVMLFAYNDGSLINRTLIIPWAEYGPDMDASTIDADVFVGPDVGMFVYVDNDFPNYGHLDCSSFFRVAYDDDGDLCIYGQVIDDTIYTAGANSYEQDCFEIYLDGDNSKGGSYDGVDDVQWRYVYGLTEDSAGWKDPGEVAWATTSNGYAMELVISAAELADTNIVLSEGDTIGFEVQVADNDGHGREVMTKWWSGSNSSWQQPVLFGTAVLGNGDITSDVIEYMEYAPTVDGTMDPDWEAVPEVTMTSIADRAFPDGGHGDLSSFFRAAYDDDGDFCFFGTVVDDSIYTAGANSYEQDCFEIYFDGNNSKGSSYDGFDDVQWRYVYGLTSDSAGWKDPGEVAWAVTDTGYNMELVISAADLADTNIALGEGSTIGFEVQVADNDGNGRECMTKWWSESNNSWQQPLLFGTVDLVDESSAFTWAPAGVPEAEADNDVKLSVSSVVGSIASVSYSIPARGSVKLTLFNLAGQAVITQNEGVKDAGTSTATLDASGLANGVYVCRIEACNQAAAQKLLVIK
jgi:hypothetical protein